LRASSLDESYTRMNFMRVADCREQPKRTMCHIRLQKNGAEDDMFVFISPTVLRYRGPKK